jgi:predicted porin
MFAGKLTLDGSLSYISGKKDNIKRSDLEGKVLLGNQFSLTTNISVGPIMGIGADKYSINYTNYANIRETISTTYGALGFRARAIPLENLKVSLNAYYKKSLIKPQYSWEGSPSSVEDFSKATGYTIEVPVEYKLTTTLGVYAKYTRDTMKFGESKYLPSLTKDHNLFSAGISYAW